MPGVKGTADEKFAALEDAGVKTVRSLADIGKALSEITGWAMKSSLLNPENRPLLRAILFRYAIRLCGNPR